MLKFVALIFAVIGCAAAKPGLIGAPLAYTAPVAVVAAAPAPFVTATSSQVIARNYNGIATAPVVAPIAAPIVAKTFAAPIAAAYTSPIVTKYAAAYTAPVAATYAAPLVTKYTAAGPLGYTSPLAYSAPLTYAAGAPVLF